MPEELFYASANELLERYRAKTLSPVEATRAVLDRIAAVNPKINAYLVVDEEGAMATARASEARWQRGEPQGLVDGIPTSIKDLLLTKGWPTLRGSRTVDPSGPWEEDAPAVARLREHGAVLLGKTTTPEFGWKGVTDGPVTGITRNPWDLTKTPGGSSGGASAAAAAGLGALHVGSDGGGSIRIPSGFAGCFGLKPNFGRVPVWPQTSGVANLTHVGPMTRTVADAALMLDVLAEPDARDWFCLPPPPVRYREALGGGVRGLRIAFSPTLGYARVDPEIAAIVAEAARAFRELGAEVTETDPGFPDPTPGFRVWWWVTRMEALGQLPPEKLALLEAPLAEMVEAGRDVPLQQFLDAANERVRLGTHMRLFHQRYDLLLTPSLAVPAFEVGILAPPGYEGRNYWLDWTPFSYPFNLTGQPAASIPCGFTAAGLPVGLQIVAANFREDLVLRAAAAYEAIRPIDRRPPI